MYLWAANSRAIINEYVSKLKKKLMRWYIARVLAFFVSFYIYNKRLNIVDMVCAYAFASMPAIKEVKYTCRDSCSVVVRKRWTMERWRYELGMRMKRRS